MIRWLSPFLASAALVAASVPAHADGGGGVQAAAPIAAPSVQATLALIALDVALRQDRAGRFVQARPVMESGIRRDFGRYGPFRVVGLNRVEMTGATDRATPEQFAAMLRDYPGIRRIDMVDCPGTHDDIANLKLGRMIRAAGIATYVPANGSVRSGAVDLFLAGRERVIDNGAEFAVHSWRDPQGREARDFAPDAVPNRNYLDYYREMGMDSDGARAFYAFTNSVPHKNALWLEAREMRAWVARAGDAPRLAADRPMLASAAAARPVIISHAMPLDSGRVAMLDVSMLDISVFQRAGMYPVTGILDSVMHL